MSTPRNVLCTIKSCCALLVGTFERRCDLAHEPLHLFFDLHVRLEACVEIENDLGKACGHNAGDRG